MGPRGCHFPFEIAQKLDLLTCGSSRVYLLLGLPEGCDLFTVCGKLQFNTGDFTFGASHISTNGSFGGYSFIMVVRTDLFDGLPEDVQAKMLALGNETAVHVAQAQDASVEGLIESWKAEGIDTYTFTEEELATITDALVAVSVDWAERLQDDKAAAVLESYSALTRE